jgi:hypothetical protein
VQAQWKIKYLDENSEHGEDMPIPPTPLSFRNVVIRELFEQETQEAKEEVERSREKAEEEEPNEEEEDIGPDE